MLHNSYCYRHLKYLKYVSPLKVHHHPLVTPGVAPSAREGNSFNALFRVWDDEDVPVRTRCSSDPHLLLRLCRLRLVGTLGHVFPN